MLPSPPSAPSSPEGDLVLRLTRSGGRVSDCRLTSTRPDVAGRLLQGRHAETVAAAVPRLYSICSDSQAVASRLALQAAAGAAADMAQIDRCHEQVATETLRETTLRVLLGWPRSLGDAPAATAVSAARAVRDGAASSRAGAETIALAVFGEPAGAWFERQTPGDWWQWAAMGASAAARFVARYRDDAPQPEVPLLPAPPDASALRDLAAASDDPRFSAAPTWLGRPAETGAVARQQRDPLVQALRAQGLHAAARQAARLRELAAMLLPAATDPQRRAADVGQLQLGAGAGLGWVHNARGLLLHVVRLDGDRAASYRIVAPTEWNFHPGGALHAALLGHPAADAATLRSHALRLVDSLDPCVSCRVEVTDA